MDWLRSHAAKRIAVHTLRSAFCVGVVACATAVLFLGLRVNALIAGFTYVLIVLIVAAKWGLAESLTTSIAAVFCLNFYFLPPVLSVTIEDPQNWVALIAFMATAITASELSSSARERAAEARARRAEVERLYQLSLTLMLVDTSRSLGSQIATSIRDGFDFAAVGFYDGSNGQVYFSGWEQGRLDSDAMRSVSKESSQWFVSRITLSKDKEQVIAPVIFGGRALGSVGLLGDAISDPAVQAIANLAAVSLEHAQQQVAFGRLEVARQNEQLRSALLDAVAHDFLTPLTGIKTAITTVRSEYGHEQEEEEFLSVIEEETDRLAEMVSEITDMARIEPGKPRIRRRKVVVADLVDESLRRMQNILKRHQLEIEVESGIAPISADPEMLGLALRQVLANASKFSAPETLIQIRAYERDGWITIVVRDHGPGINIEEKKLIFERFYRGRDTEKSAAGTGMGLSIARDILQAHQGRVSAENAPGGGAQFSFKLPAYDERRTL